MTDRPTAPEELEQQLQAALRSLGDRLVDADFAGQLYRGLAGRAWRRDGVDDGSHVTLSWKRAEELVNVLRAERGEQDGLTLAQTGGEGTLSGAVEEELAGLGWRSRPVDPDGHDPQHVASARDEPRTAPDAERFARAHADAERERERQARGTTTSR